MMMHESHVIDVGRALGEVSLDDRADSIPMSRPSTPEAQIRRQPEDMRDVPAPAIRPKWSERPSRRREAWPAPDDLVDDDDDLDCVTETYDPITGERTGFVSGDDWHAHKTMADLVDEALVLTRASWHMDAFRMGLFDDCANKFLSDRKAALACYAVC